MEKASDVGHYTTFIGMLSIAQIGNLEKLLWRVEGRPSTIVRMQREKLTDRDTEVFLGDLESQARVTMAVGLSYGMSEIDSKANRPAYLVQFVIVNEVRSMAMNEGATGIQYDLRPEGEYKGICVQSKTVGPAVGEVSDVAFLVRGCLTLTPKKQALLCRHTFLTSKEQ